MTATSSSRVTGGDGPHRPGALLLQAPHAACGPPQRTLATEDAGRLYRNRRMAGLGMHLTILDLRLPEGTWPGDVSRAHRKALLRVESYLPQGPGRGTLMVRVAYPEPDRVLRDIQAHPSVQSMEVVKPAEDGEALAKVVTGEPRLLDVAVRYGVVPDLPLVIQDGQITWRIRGQQPGIQAFREGLQSAGVSSEVRFIGEFRPAAELTKRQQEILTSAVNAGFYDYPRRITLTRLAKQFSITPSTLSETLMVVEKKVVHRFMEDTGRKTSGR